MSAAHREPTNAEVRHAEKELNREAKEARHKLEEKFGPLYPAMSRKEAMKMLENRGWKLSGKAKSNYLYLATNGLLPTGPFEGIEPDWGFINALSGGLAELLFGKPTGVKVPSKNPGKVERYEKESVAEKVGNAIAGAPSWLLDLITGQGIRLLEILGGGVLVLFGLITIVHGDTPPVPIPVPV